MKLHSRDDHNIVLKVSRRNVLTLLHKIHTPGSARTLFQNGSGSAVTLIAETDEAHYAERLEQFGDQGKPGPVQMDATTVLQVATDLVEQVCDGMEPPLDEFDRRVFVTVTHQLAYLRERADGKIAVV